MLSASASRSCQSPRKKSWRVSANRPLYIRLPGTAMRDFEYLVPENLAEASGFLAQHGENCRMIAGGTALLLAVGQRMIAPSHLISLARIRSLRGITYDDRTG